MNKAIFLDRDGTINVDDKEIFLPRLNKKVKGYIHKIEDWEFIPKALEALIKLSESEYKLIIITNQSGIGRGYYTEEDLKKLHLHVLSYNHVRIDGVYFCPHHPEKARGVYKKFCDCRKPGIGLIKKAAQEHNIDLTKSYMIGDKTTDIECGRRAGCKTILVETGNAGTDGTYNAAPDFTATNLHMAAEMILKQNE
ncbi:HAD family hydrolase [Candidatus Woesearchaeota archaeon]|nr:HAD family hydrolase [Candidatus Woesearchaeota archaeon]